MTSKWYKQQKVFHNGAQHQRKLDKLASSMELNHIIGQLFITHITSSAAYSLFPPLHPVVHRPMQTKPVMACLPERCTAELDREHCLFMALPGSDTLCCPARFSSRRNLPLSFLCSICCTGIFLLFFFRHLVSSCLRAAPEADVTKVLKTTISFTLRG